MALCQHRHEQLGCQALTVAAAEEAFETAGVESGVIMMMQHVELPYDTAKQLDEVFEKCQQESMPKTLAARFGPHTEVQDMGYPGLE